MEKVLRASPSDFDSVMQLADTCFLGDQNRGGMLARWGHCYIHEPEHLRRHLIIRDGARVVGHVAYIDQTAIVDGGEIRCAGISGVATHPDYRKKGLMTRLLNHCIDAMGTEGYPLSDLGGDTQRYRRFGWERAGRQWVINLSPRSIGEVSAPVGWTVTSYGSTDADLAFIRAIHESESVRMARGETMYRLLLARKGWQTWLAERQDNRRAYMVVQADDPKRQTVSEVGGHAEGVHAIITSLMRDRGVESLTISLPWRHPLQRAMLRISCGWHVPPSRMLRINDLAGTLRGFLPHLRRRYEQSGMRGRRSFALEIAGTHEKARVVLAPGEAAVETEAVRGTLKLDRLQMVRLLFGPGSPSHEVDLPERLRFLDAILPLDFYVWGLEGV
jgi:predicted acetyltransferase